MGGITKNMKNKFSNLNKQQLYKKLNEHFKESDLLLHEIINRDEKEDLATPFDLGEEFLKRREERSK